MITAFLLSWAIAQTPSTPAAAKQTAKPLGKGPVISQTVGTAGFQVVTSREVKASSLLGQAMKSELQNPLVSSESEASASSRMVTSINEINATLFEIAIFRESQSLSAVKLSESELNELLSTTRSRLQNNREWKRLEVQDQEFKQWVERKRIAEVFLELKTSSLTSIVTEQEIQDYYERNRVKFGSTPLSEQRDNIYRFLQKESQKQRVQDWLSALKTKYQVRNDLGEEQKSSSQPAANDPAKVEN